MASLIESLTGLPTAAALRADLDKALDTEDTVSLALLDIDNFKVINDTQGHTKGDELLVALARLMESQTTGKVYRVSGDEFAVLLAGQPLERAFLQMEGLRAAVQAAGAALPVAATITVGVVEFPRNGKDGQTILQVADDALLAAKQAGRNQVGMAPSEDMIMKSCYYSAASVRRLKAIAERLGRKESELLREALADLIRKYDQR